MLHPFTIEQITVALGDRKIDIRERFPAFAPVISKTGIETVYEASKNSLELASESLSLMLDLFPHLRQDTCCLLVVTQSPIDVLPNMASVLQNDCQLPTNILAFDINQGCSGFVQALLLTAHLINNYHNILITCVDTYRSKLDPGDRSTACLFSDAATTTWVSQRPTTQILASTSYTDGAGRDKLFQTYTDMKMSKLQMSGADVLLFTQRVVPTQLEEVVKSARKSLNEVDVCYLHQASQIVIDAIRKRVPDIKRYPSNISEYGNTVSSSVPLLLQPKINEFQSEIAILAGFGVGLSSSVLLTAPA